MSNIREFTINGDHIMFINRFRNTRNGFAHDTEFLYNGVCLVETTCHYINRTWENYAYQTVMLSAIHEAMEACKERCKRNFKALNGYSKMTATRNEEFEKMLSDSKEYQKFIQIRDIIRGRVW